MGKAGRQKASHFLHHLLLLYKRGTCVSAIRTVCESELIRKEEIIEAIKLGNRRREQPFVCKVCVREKAKS